MGNQNRACLLEATATFIAKDLGKTANLNNFINKSKPGVQSQPALLTYKQCPKTFILCTLENLQ
jgi:hypothetical protein